MKEARQKRVCNVWFHLYKTRKCKLIYSDSKSVVIWGGKWEQGVVGGSDYKGALGNAGEWWICYLYSGFMGIWVLWVYICQNLANVYFRYCSLCQIYLNKTVYSFLKSDPRGRNSCIQEWRAPCSLIVFLTKFLPIYNFKDSQRYILDVNFFLTGLHNKYLFYDLALLYSLFNIVYYWIGYLQVFLLLFLFFAIKCNSVMNTLVTK